MSAKVINTIFGRRRAFCNCEFRLTKERDEYLQTINKHITYEETKCLRCGYYPVSFENPDHARHYVRLRR